MHHTDPFERLAVDPLTAVMVDRRQRHLELAASAAGLAVRGAWTLHSPVSATVVYAALLAPNGEVASFAFPRRIKTADAAYTRMVDRFYVPDLPGPEVAAALFDVIAVMYDRLTTPEINRAVARDLLLAVITGREIDRLRILDFGCGTGVALTACLKLPAASGAIELIGTDASPSMIRLARGRGELALTLEEWRMHPSASLDGAIAAFVLHYGVPAADLERIARQLKPGARFAANFFKPRPGDVAAVVRTLTAFNLRLERVEELHETSGENPMLVFAKREEWPR